MKVCDVVLNSIWYDPRVRKQINEYLAHGVDVCCVGFRCDRYDEEKVAAIPCPTTITSLPKNLNGKQRGIFRKLARERKRDQLMCDAIVACRPDIIHANDLTGLIPAYKASKKLKCKLVYDSHEICTENLFLKGNPLYAWLLRVQEKCICKRIDRMICVSNAAAEYFENEYHIPKPTVITNCTLKAEQCFEAPKNEGFEILNHGQFYAGRGYDILVEAAALLKDYPDIKLAMRGFGKMERQLRDRVAALQAENVRFYPPVLVQELISHAARSMVGVAMTEDICLNFKLSVSNKLFEYAAAGLPVIMSDIPEHRYLNKQYEFGVILSENTPQAFAEAVVRLYTDKPFYAMCAENAKKMSAEVNWENEFSALISWERDQL